MAKKAALSESAAPAQGRPSALVDTRVIYCGDNLELLAKLPDACVDLVYIDPPFNSNRNYEVFWGETKEKRSFDDRHESTKAYIDFMRPRCLALHRVLKPTGSFYYHCDWHASHYVKVMLDGIFGENNFRCEIVWKRTFAHGNVGRNFGNIADSIFFYTLGEKYAWNQPYDKLDPEQIKEKYPFNDPGGRAWQSVTLRNPGVRPNLHFTYTASNGISYQPHPNGWSCNLERMQKYDREGRLHFPAKPTGALRLKMYADESSGERLQNIWTDLPPISANATERLGYPTQKPIALLERILSASSNPNDVVLDAFCGCGTALVAAEKLGRQWIGIDLSPTACRVMAKRLRDVCKLREGEALRAAGKGFAVRCLPFTEETLRKMPPFEFQNWAVNALGAVCGPRGADGGIDGRFFFADSPPTSDPSALGFMDDWYPVQVKQEDKAGLPEIMSFEAVLTRDKRKTGYFVAFGFTQDARDEARRFMLSDHRHIIPFTVGEILDGSFAEKMA